MVDERAENVRSLALRLGMVDPETFRRLPMGDGPHPMGKTTEMLLGILADLADCAEPPVAVIVVSNTQVHANTITSLLRGWGEKLGVRVPELLARTPRTVSRQPVPDDQVHDAPRYYDHSCFE